ncbi:MAG: FtsX-like permease family protein [Anaerolineales bacterium]
MAFKKLWVIAFRDLGRNRRRSSLTMLAVALGLALLILMSGYIAGVVDGSISDSIILNTGHVQVRAESYEVEKASLQWQDLLDNSSDLLVSAAKIDGVKAVAPALWASGFLVTGDETIGVRVTGIDPDSGFHEPIRQGIVTGEYLAADDRDGVLIGKNLADSLGIGAGSKISLLVGTSDDEIDEDIFTVRGVFSTGVLTYDESTVYLALSKAQAITGSGDRISAVIVLTEDAETAIPVAAALHGPGRSVVTWEDMNALILQAIETGMSFYFLLYGIVILVVAVIIANTLLMSVFERTRELGIMAALGMKERQIMTMILLEASTLAFLGIIGGIVLGSLAVWSLAINGIPIGDEIASVAQGIALRNVLYTKFVPADIFGLSLATLIIVLLGALYPARFAARLEPVEALHAL